MAIENIISQIKSDWEQCDQIINNSLGSKVPLIEQINAHITKKPGKRIRPLISILTAKTFGYNGKNHALLGAIIELIHTATLLHDDVIDESNLRRGQKTANSIWDNTASILTGDFLYSRAFQLMNEIGSLKVMKILADTSNQISEGEMLQLTSIKNPDISIEHYNKVISLKTAKLFEAASELSAVITEQEDNIIKTCANYGKHLGIAFQLVDDILDYSSTDAKMGKQTGDDLKEGKPTLPILIAMEKADNNQKNLIRGAILNADGSKFNEINNILEKTGALNLAKKQALTEANKAKQELEKLPDNNYRQLLSELCDLSVHRIY
jgi:octaprenyl-diphosphate synthase